MKIDLKNKYHLALILTISVVGFMSAMVLLSPYTQNPGNQDMDKDTVPDAADNCPTVPNSDQSDADDDGTGDVCDSCTDTDKDGYGDPGHPQNTCPLDNCPGTANTNQTDSDQDSVGDACDTCPDDPLNDADDDKICGGVDNCPAVYNPAQTDSDTDGVGDACEMPPTADFSYHPFDPIRGEVIQFSDTTIQGGGILQERRWTFGDNTSSVEQHPTHQYLSIGTYTVALNVTDINGKTSMITKQVTVIPNDPPHPPTITGPVFGRAGVNYIYVVTATDPDGNELFYFIDWGENTRTDPLGPFSSGETIAVNQSWKNPGQYHITMKARDTHNTESRSTSFSVRITDLYLLNPGFLEFFEQNHQILLYHLLYR